MTAKTKAAKIKASLIKQLEDIGADVEHYRDLVNDYCSLWSVKEKLIEDIELRGVVCETVTNSGLPVEKNNPSVKDLVSVNKQMLTLLEKLGLTTANVRSEEGDEL